MCKLHICLKVVAKHNVDSKFLSELEMLKMVAFNYGLLNFRASKKEVMKNIKNGVYNVY
jgi:hypothetical protein